MDKKTKPSEPTEPAITGGLERSTSNVGHDAPISTLSEDRLERGSLARSIFRDIKDTRLEFSTRIGLYGEWGSGKTSVLNLVKELATQQGDIFISLSAWKVVDLNDFLTSLYKAIAHALKKNRVTPSKRLRLKHWGRKATEGTQAFAEMAGQTAGKFDNDLASVAVVGSAVLDSLMSSVNRRLTLDEHEIKALRALLQDDHRIIVSIDDLDRADPVALPKLLLSLRELMDLPGFAFILAFDPLIVNQALKAYSITYSEERLDNPRQPFLEKIIDLSHTLKELSSENTKQFAVHQLLTNCSFIPRPEIDRAAEWFPNNPRLIKLITRELRNFKYAAQRHEVGDLAWEAIIVHTVLKKTAPATTKLAELSLIGQDSANRAMAFSDGKKEDASKLFSQAMDASAFKDGTVSQNRLKKTLIKLQSLRNWQTVERINYEMNLSTKEPILTPKEYRAIRALWQQTFNIKTLQTQLINHKKSANCGTTEVINNLINHALDDYKSLVGKLTQFRTSTEASIAIAEAEKTIDFMCDLSQPDMPDDFKLALDNTELLLRLADIFVDFSLRDFNCNELFLRNREQWLVQRTCNLVTGSSKLYYHGNQMLIRLSKRENAELAYYVPNNLIQAGLDSAIAEAVDFLLIEGGIKLLTMDYRSDLKSPAAEKVEFLTNPDSLLYQSGHIDKLLAIFTIPPTNDSYISITENVYGYIELLLADLKSATKFYAFHRPLLEECWQFLLQSGLRKERGLDWLHHRLGIAAGNPKAFKYPAGYQTIAP